MNSARDKILARLRQAPPPAMELPALLPDEAIYADFPESDDTALRQAFVERLSALHGEVHVVSDDAGARSKIFELVRGAGTVLVQDHPWLKELCGEDTATDLSISWHTDSGMTSPVMAEFGVGISVADFLIARTGSILLRCTMCGGRRLSVLPPLHIVVGKQQQLVPSLDKALAQLKFEDDTCSSIAVITGPSRTADIEKILVLGAHGPKRLVVVLIADQVQT